MTKRNLVNQKDVVTVESSKNKKEKRKEPSNLAQLKVYIIDHVWGGHSFEEAKDALARLFEEDDIINE